MNSTTKTLIVLAPGGLMGAGVGALIGAFSTDPASPAVFPLQVVGVMMWLGAIALRFLLSEAELRLSTFAGLISNSVATFLSGAAVVLGLRLVTGAPDQATAWRALAIVALAWVPCCVITLGILLITAPLRKRFSNAPES
jgi:hypothetical protein